VHISQITLCSEFELGPYLLHIFPEPNPRTRAALHPFVPSPPACDRRKKITSWEAEAGGGGGSGRGGGGGGGGGSGSGGGGGGGGGSGGGGGGSCVWMGAEGGEKDVG
jgi:hypothetical protein